MPRKWRIDGEEQLPANVQPAGYDADGQRSYYRRSTDGQYFQSSADSPLLTAQGVPNSEPVALGEVYDASDPDRQNRQWWRYFGPFCLVVLVALGALVWWIRTHEGGAGSRLPPGPSSCESPATRHTVAKGDTCYGLAHGDMDAVAEIARLNPQADCDGLAVGQALCLPAGL